MYDKRLALLFLLLDLACSSVKACFSAPAPALISPGGSTLSSCTVPRSHTALLLPISELVTSACNIIGHGPTPQILQDLLLLGTVVSVAYGTVVYYFIAQQPAIQRCTSLTRCNALTKV